ncbi:MAG TPA: PaaI family thioesterase [Acidimicrobiia bacterium]|jgi:acyl-coenzyme A thioesterase PaaI-like protein|nr:PaaI family thioesterase [Acidimicrobiia bacterium]
MAGEASGTTSIQEQHNPEGMCFGCGPANPVGLGLRSFPDGEVVTADVVIPATHENGYGIANGGVVTTLLDCHTGAVLVNELHGYDWAEHPPFLTYRLDVALSRPTPVETPVRLVGRLVERKSTELVVEAEIIGPDGKTTAKLRAGWRPVLRALTRY